MTHGSLFSGIGGFDLAAEWMGWENIFHCEWNEFGQKILKHYWPKAKSYGDITKTDFTIHGGQIDILTGGFPCQPYSLAGKRKGKEDDRHLWPEMLRAITEIQPRWIVGENVFGLVNWDGGVVFHEVQTDLEAAGYEVWPYVLPACAVNAPHRRDRVWFVAHSTSRTKRSSGSCGKTEGNGCKNNAKQDGWGIKAEFNNGCGKFLWTTPNSDSDGQQWGDSEDEINPSKRRQYAQCYTGEGFINESTPNPISGGQQGQGQTKRPGNSAEIEDRETDRIDGNNEGSWLPADWSKFPTQSPVCNGDDGFPSGLDGITFSKWRQESIKGGGNAVVPQVVYQIFKAIEEFDRQNGEHIF